MVILKPRANEELLTIGTVEKLLVQPRDTLPHLGDEVKAELTEGNPRREIEQKIRYVLGPWKRRQRSKSP